MVNLSGFGGIRQALANRNFRLYVFGSLISDFGIAFQRIAVGWLTWDLTHSPAWLGIMAFALLSPTLLLGPIAGALVDRLDYLKTAITTESFLGLQATALCALIYTELMTIEYLLAFTLLRGLIYSVDRTARQALVYDIVGRDLITSAVALNAIVFNGARFVGPALGGIIIVNYGIGSTFAVTAITYLVFVLSMLAAKRDGNKKVKTDTRRNLFAEAWSGVTYWARHPGLGPLFIIIIITALTVRPILDLMPGFADLVFGKGVDGLAALMAAHGFGAMIAGFFVAHRGEISGLTWILVRNLAYLAVTVIIFVATDIYWVGILGSGLVGFTLFVQNVNVQILVQASATEQNRGRVIAVHGIVSRGGPAVGAVLLGMLAEVFGLQLPLMAGACICFVLFAWALRHQATLAEALETDPAASLPSSQA